MQTTRRGFFGVLAAAVVPVTAIPVFTNGVGPFVSFGPGALAILHGSERVLLRPIDLSLVDQLETDWVDSFFDMGAKPIEIELSGRWE